MPESRPKAARTAVLAGAGLLTSTIAFLAVAPAQAAESTHLGFDVAALAAAPDGGVVAVGTVNSNESAGPLAAFVKDGTSTPIAGLPSDGAVSTVSFAHGLFVIGGRDSAGAQTWSVDPAAATPTAVALDGPLGWSSVDTSAATGDTLALAGTRTDEMNGSQVVVSTDSGATSTVLPGAEYARDIAVDATGGAATTYAVGNSYDPEAQTESGHLWVAGADGHVDDFPVGVDPTAVAESGGTVFIADQVTEGTAFGGEVRAFDGADGHLLGTVSFADSGWVRDLATSADGSTLYVTTNYSLYAVPVSGFAAFDPATAPDAEADGGSSLGALAITEAGGQVTAYTTADDSSVVALTAPGQPSFSVKIDDYDPTSIAVTLPDDVARSNYRAVLSAGGTTVKGAPDGCVRDNDTNTTSCTFESLQRGVDYDVTVSVTNALGTSSTVHSVRTPGLLAGPSSVSFSGTAQVGATLTANVGTGWPAGTTFSYEWGYSTGQMGDLVATTPTFKVPARLAGTYLTLIVTGRKGADFRQVASRAVVVKAAPSALPTLPTTAKATPQVTGKAKVGKTITATVGAWPKGTTLRYQWYSNGKAVKGATKKALKLTKSFKGKKVNVSVTGTKPGYAAVTRASKPVKVS